jgi:hypothetical protein
MGRLSVRVTSLFRPCLRFALVQIFPQRSLQSPFFFGSFDLRLRARFGVFAVFGAHYELLYIILCAVVQKMQGLQDR